MSAHFTLTLDTAPPSSPLLLIDGGIDRTGSQLVSVAVTSPDADTQEMLLWGDVDEAHDPDVQRLETDSTWVSYSPTERLVRLSPGQARKRLYARLRDDVGNETAAFADWVDYDISVPTVEITLAPSRAKVSKVPPAHVTVFGWEANVVFDRYEVRAVPTAGSPRAAGPQIGTAHGSANVSGVGTFASEVPISTSVTGGDLEAASPGDGQKVVKVFVRSADTQAWSA